jgi:endoglucanase
MISLAVAFLSLAAAASAVAADSTIVIRVNQAGYLPDAPKVAVVCALDSARVTRVTRTFVLRDDRGRTTYGPRRAVMSGAFGPCERTWRLDFTQLKRSGRYRIVAFGVTSRELRIDAHAYDGGADTLLSYMREQRSGWNPIIGDSLHTHDGIAIDDSGHAVKFVPVSGGWADASDYLQYVTTSANATYMMLLAFRDHPEAFDDQFDGRGALGKNGIPDVLDEARHGLDWLLRMFPGYGEMYNQLGDDRDHEYFDLPWNDSTDYGWGKGRERPVYPCTGRPQGLFGYKNRSTGLASTAGKYASAFALGAQLYTVRDSVLADSLKRRSLLAFVLGTRNEGVCQTAPGRAPYFYEEANWADDMELAAAELYALTGDRVLLGQAVSFAETEPVTPWMGADTARHYEFFPWYNNGHYAAWRTALGTSIRIEMEEYYRRGLDAVVARANNGFRVGIPFIWCSNDLMTAFATQAMLYRRMTGDQRYREYEQAAVDWLLGTNPWGTSMVIGWPNDGVWAHDPHSAVAKQLGVERLRGGLLDGPVYRSIFQNLKGIALHDPDEYAPFNTGFIVYHDDVGDYSTNEPIMDGTASLVYLLSGYETEGTSCGERSGGCASLQGQPRNTTRKRVPTRTARAGSRGKP